MPYREKTAWLTFIAMIATFGPYFAIVGTHARTTSASTVVSQLALFAAAVIVQVAVMVAGSAYLAITAPREARTPPDERDRAISGRSVAYAYYVLMAGIILVGCIMPFNSNGFGIVNAALAMIVAAELVHYGVIVFSYRRQA